MVHCPCTALPPSTVVPIQAQQPPLCIVFVFWEVETDLLFLIKKKKCKSLKILYCVMTTVKIFKFVIKRLMLLKF